MEDQSFTSDPFTARPYHVDTHDDPLSNQTSNVSFPFVNLWSDQATTSDTERFAITTLDAPHTYEPDSSVQAATILQQTAPTTHQCLGCEQFR